MGWKEFAQTDKPDKHSGHEEHVKKALPKYLEWQYPYLADVLKKDVKFVGAATPENIKQRIPELGDDMQLAWEDFGVGHHKGTLGAQKEGNILFSFGGGKNLLDLLSHEVGHTATEANPTWSGMLSRFQFPPEMAGELWRAGYPTSESYKRIRKQQQQSVKDGWVEPDSPGLFPGLSDEDYELMDNIAKEEFFLRRAQDRYTSTNPQHYLDEPQKVTPFLDKHVRTLPPEKQAEIKYFARRYSDFLKFGPDVWDFWDLE